MNSFIHTNNSSDVRLVAAVGAMGILCEPDGSNTPTLAVAGHNGTVRTWLMSAVSNCGKWKLGDLLSWWRDRQFHETHGDHPFNRVKCAMANKRALSIAIRENKSVTAVRRGKSLIFEVLESTTPAAAPFPGAKITDNLDKVSAFLAMGFECSEVAVPGSRRAFQIPAHVTTGLPTRDVLDVAWSDNSFHLRNPDHDFSYIKAALGNYKYLVGAIKQDKPLVEIRKGESFAFLHPDCSAETERKIMTQFNQ